MENEEEEDSRKRRKTDKGTFKKSLILETQEEDAEVEELREEPSDHGNSDLVLSGAGDSVASTSANPPPPPPPSSAARYKRISSRTRIRQEEELARNIENAIAVLDRDKQNEEMVEENSTGARTPPSAQQQVEDEMVEETSAGARTPPSAQQQVEDEEMMEETSAAGANVAKTPPPAQQQVEDGERFSDDAAKTPPPQQQPHPETPRTRCPHTPPNTNCSRILRAAAAALTSDSTDTEKENRAPPPIFLSRYPRLASTVVTVVEKEMEECARRIGKRTAEAMLNFLS